MALHARLWNSRANRPPPFSSSNIPLFSSSNQYNCLHIKMCRTVNPQGIFSNGVTRLHCEIFSTLNGRIKPLTIENVDNKAIAGFRALNCNRSGKVVYLGKIDILHIVTIYTSTSGLTRAGVIYEISHVLSLFPIWPPVQS
jgi:hypothetical protein